MKPISARATITPDPVMIGNTMLFLQFIKKGILKLMKQSALKSAAYKECLAYIINDMIETLAKERFELPNFTTLERIARAVS